MSALLYPTKTSAERGCCFPFEQLHTLSAGSRPAPPLERLAVTLRLSQPRHLNTQNDRLQIRDSPHQNLKESLPPRKWCTLLCAKMQIITEASSHVINLTSYNAACEYTPCRRGSSSRGAREIKVRVKPVCFAPPAVFRQRNSCRVLSL